MAVHFRIPAHLQTLTAGHAVVLLRGDSLGEVIADLGSIHDALRHQILDEHGRLRRSVRLFINDQDMPYTSGLETRIRDGDEVTLVVALAGG
jgi:molybdopterin synthase sulfur carrier subunit